MPYYDFLNEKTSEIKTLFFHMNDEKRYVDESGYEWIRQFSSINAAVDTQINPFSAKEFSEKTANKKDTVGAMWDRSKEASLKREQKAGKDEIKESYYKNYSKRRKGHQHPDKDKTDVYTI